MLLTILVSSCHNIVETKARETGVTKTEREREKKRRREKAKEKRKKIKKEENNRSKKGGRRMEGELVLKEEKVYILKDKELRVEIIQLYYNVLVAGYGGRWKITELITRNYW